MAGEENLENELDFSGTQLGVISMRLLKSNQNAWYLHCRGVVSFLFYTSWATPGNYA